MTNILINYRREDSLPYVGRMRDHLEKVYQPNKIFLDITNIEGGENYTSIIEKTIKECECCIVVIGPSWLKAEKHGKLRLNDPKDLVRREIILALKYGIKIVPILVGKAKMPVKDELISPLKELSELHALDLSDERFSFDMKRLICLIGGATGTIRFFIHKSLKKYLSLAYKENGFKLPSCEHSIILDEVYKGKLAGPIQVKEGERKIQILEGPPLKHRFPKYRSLFSKLNKTYLARNHISISKDSILFNYSFFRSSNALRFRIKSGQNIELFLANTYFERGAANTLLKRGAELYIDFKT